MLFALFNKSVDSVVCHCSFINGPYNLHACLMRHHNIVRPHSEYLNRICQTVLGVTHKEIHHQYGQPDENQGITLV